MSVAVAESPYVPFVPASPAEEMPRVELPTAAGPFVLEFVEQVPGTEVWRVEGRKRGLEPAQHFYVRLLPPLTVQEQERRWVRAFHRAKRAGLPIPPMPARVTRFQDERLKARIRAEKAATVTVAA
jgi:hypothetical protein